MWVFIVTSSFKGVYFCVEISIKDIFTSPHTPHTGWGLLDAKATLELSDLSQTVGNK